MDQPSKPLEMLVMASAYRKERWIYKSIFKNCKQQLPLANEAPGSRTGVNVLRHLSGQLPLGSAIVLSRAPRAFVYVLVAVVIAGCNSRGPSPTTATHDEAITDSESGLTHTLSEDGSIRVSFRDQVENLTCLEFNPSEIESELLHGRWLVIVFSTLSAPDVRSAAKSREFAGRLRNVARVAIRPTRDFTEARKWIPDYEQIEGIDVENVTTPLWLLIENGKVVRWHRGLMENQQVIEFAGNAGS